MSSIAFFIPEDCVRERPYLQFVSNIYNYVGINNPSEILSFINYRIVFRLIKQYPLLDVCKRKELY